MEIRLKTLISTSLSEINIQIVKNPTEISLPKVKFKRHSDDIILMEFLDDTTLEIEDIEDLQKAHIAIMGTKPCKVLSIISPTFSVTKEAREHGHSEEAHKYVKASAIVLSTMAHRILGNFYIKIQRPARPTKMFNNVENALTWLESLD